MKTMTDLFTMDPMDMTNSDIDNIISHFRENRRKFLANPAAASKPKKTAKPKPTDGLDLKIEL